MLCHHITKFDQVFLPNTQVDTQRKDPIYLNKLCQGDTVWYTKHIIPRWALDMPRQILTLPPHRVETVTEDLNLINPNNPWTSIHWWRNLLGVLGRIIPAVDGA